MDKESALIPDERGWGFVSSIISDEAALNRLADFQDDSDTGKVHAVALTASPVRALLAHPAVH